jgi:hypothetical protein
MQYDDKNILPANKSIPPIGTVGLQIRPITAKLKD